MGKKESNPLPPKGTVRPKPPPAPPKLKRSRAVIKLNHVNITKGMKLIIKEK